MLEYYHHENHQDGNKVEMKEGASRCDSLIKYKADIDLCLPLKLDFLKLIRIHTFNLIKPRLSYQKTNNKVSIILFTMAINYPNFKSYPSQFNGCCRRN